MKRLSVFRICALFLAGLAIALPGHAQTITGQIGGVVTDSLGAVVPGAIVTVVNSDTGEVVRTISTDSKGTYTVPLLQVGTYSVHIAIPGFGPRSVDNIQVSVSDTLRIDVQLSPADQQVVNVIGNNNLAPQLEDAASSTVITGTEMRELALNTRNFEQMVTLQPGVSFGGTSDQIYTGLIQPNGQQNNANMSINGLRATQNSWLLDGADMLAHNTGQQVVIFPSIDAIQELKVLRNSYGAQYGGGGSAQIQLITKAGGNSYHGDVFFFFRNAALNANNYFNNLAGQPRPEDNQYDSGFTFGGPFFIPRLYPKGSSHTYFFYSLDVKRDAVATVQNFSQAPSQAELQGTFPTPVCLAYNAAGTTCTSESTQVTNIDPVAAAYVKDVFAGFPALNNPTNPQGLILDQLGIHNETENLFRIDHSFSPRLSAFFRFVNDPVFVLAPNGIYKTQGFPGLTTTNIYTTGTSYLAHATFAVTAATVLDAAFNYQPYSIQATPIGTMAAQNAPDVMALIHLPFVSTLPRVPALSINSVSYGVNGPISDINHTYQSFANLFHVFGQHSVSVGFNFEHYSEVVNQGTNNGGLYNFNGNGPSGTGTTSYQQSLANFLQGRIDTFQQNSIDPIARPLVTLYEAYIQDDWKLKPRLTVNVGVRYSFYKQFTEAQQHLGSFAPAYFNPALAPAIDSNGNICTTAPCPGGSSPNPNYNPSFNNGLIQGGISSPFGNAVSPQPWLNFAPRVGFAYDLFGDGKTSLRAGYGLYYDQTELQVEQQTVFNNPAYVQVVTFNSPGSFANPGSNSSSAPLSAYGISTNWKTPYTQAYSIGIEQQFPDNTILEVAYAGNVSTHLIGQLDLNQPFPGEYIATGLFYTNNSSVCPTAPSTPSCNVVTHANTPLLNMIRPYRGYSTIIQDATIFTANYNALQATLNKSFGTHSRLSVNYTWSRGLTTNQNDTGSAPQNSYDIPAEYGLVGFDRRHILTAHFVYDLPFYEKQQGFKGHALGGWEISGIVTFAAGLPLTVTSANVDPAGQGILAPTSPEIGRQDCVGDVNGDAPHTQLEWFNIAHFVKVPNGRPGDCPNSNVRGPGYQVWNLDLFKNIPIHQGMYVQFRAEAFNVWNHTNWTTVNTAEVDAIVAQVTAARDPRQMQLGVKFIF